MKKIINLSKKATNNFKQCVFHCRNKAGLGRSQQVFELFGKSHIRNSLLDTNMVASRLQYFKILCCYRFGLGMLMGGLARAGFPEALQDGPLGPFKSQKLIKLLSFRALNFVIPSSVFACTFRYRRLTSLDSSETVTNCNYIWGC